MVYTLVLEASAERIKSSSLFSRTRIRGCSSAGRATALQAEGQGFDPPLLHQLFKEDYENTKTSESRSYRFNKA